MPPLPAHTINTFPTPLGVYDNAGLPRDDGRENPLWASTVEPTTTTNEEDANPIPTIGGGGQEPPIVTGNTAVGEVPEPEDIGALSAAYLKRANTYCEANGIALRSTVLFGGQVKGYTSAASDVDVIFIVDNETPKSEISSLITYLQGVEVELGIRKPSKGRFSVILDRIGAQQKSVFVCKEKDFASGDVPNIFRSDSPLDSAILDNPMWATDIGLKNILLTARTVQGEDLLPHLRGKVTPIQERDLRRNRRMYTALGLFAIGAYPFTNNATKYSMSSLKWALHSSYFGGRGELGSIEEEAAYYKEQLPDTRVPATLDKLLALRDSYHSSLSFNVAALLASRAIFKHALATGSFPVDVRKHLHEERA